MDLEANKVAGAVLGSLVLLMALSVISDVIYRPAAVKTAGYDIPVPAEEKAPAPAAASAAAPAASGSVAALLATADAAKGASDARVCQTCHSFEKGAAAKVGPPLYGIVGRAKASVPGFSYSEGVKAKGGAWTFDDLDKFIENPKGYAPGTKMAFGGEKDAGKRASIVAYLRSLSESPVPLPK